MSDDDNLPVSTVSSRVYFQACLTVFFMVIKSKNGAPGPECCERRFMWLWDRMCADYDSKRNFPRLFWLTRQR